MIHRVFLVFWVFLFFGCKTTLDSRESEKSFSSEKKPNVIFILADDLGLHDLSVTGSSYYETPNIDRIAKEGTIFTQGYAASRVCSPSRASIMLGQFTARHRITDWIGAASGAKWRKQGHNDKVLPAEYVHQLPQGEITLPEAMQNNGYKTFFAGKWHLGEEESYPEDHGFHVNKGGWESGSPIGGYFSPWDNPKLSNKKEGENLSMRLAKETSGFIEENKGAPFFAFLSFYAVHGPIQTTEEKWKKYRDKAEAQGMADSGYEMERNLPIRVEQDNPIYAGLVEQMDDAVGLVLNKLKELRLEKNTIVIFTSDNGGVASGDAFSTTNLPLRGGKGYQWEGGIREPYFIKVPWMENAPKTVDYPVIGTDFYPTILDLTNIPLKPKQHLDGISLEPLLKGEKLKERSLIWHYPHYGNQGGDPSSMIRRGELKLIHYWEDGHHELYNLEQDPGEQIDLAGKYPNKLIALSEELMNFLEKVNANLPKKDSLFDQNLAKKQYQDRKDIMLPRLEKEREEMLKKDFKPNKTWWNSKVTKD